jgi:thioredoxin-dependent peroxiredoxin
MKKILAAVSFVVATLTALPAFAGLPTGAAAPDFKATAAIGGKTFEFKLSDALKKGPVVVYFFPAAFTAGCTIETNQFAEAADQFAAAGATLIGVTGGAATPPVAGQKQEYFNAADNIDLLIKFSAEHCRDKFPIGAISADTAKAYDVPSQMKEGWSDRTSFVIAPDGKILLSFTDPKANDHVSKTLAAVQAWKAAHAKAH